MRPRHTVHPERRRSCASMRPRHTVHPERKKANPIWSSLLLFSTAFIRSLALHA